LRYKHDIYYIRDPPPTRFATLLHMLRDARIGCYSAFVSTMPLPIFFQPWWLEAACGAGNWDVALLERNGRVEAALPFRRKRLLGLTVLNLPPYTPFLGPIHAPSKARYARALAREHDIHERLIKSLPPHQAFSQTFSPAVTNWQAFRWNGFSQRTNYTYVLTGLREAPKLLAETEDNIRTDIRKAQNRFALKVEEITDLEIFLEVYAKTWARQGLTVPYVEVVRRLDAACAERRCRRILVAVDSEGRKHAAAYTVWDGETAYYLMGGGDPALRGSGAHSLVVWESILRAGRDVNCFDFEGSDIRSVERHFRAFGARQIPLLHVEKIPLWIKAGGTLYRRLRQRKSAL